MRIMCVDDEPLMLQMLELAVREAKPDADIETFDEPEDLLEAAKKDGCDVAFLDIHMGGMTGVELAKELKAVNPKMNIIFVTGFSEYTGDAMRLRASGYIMKPVTTEAVKEELDELRFPIVPKENALLKVQCFGNFDVFTPDGKPINLSDFVGRGNYVLADFWASWCSPCIAEIPHVIELHEKYKDKGLKVIGITVRDAPEKSGKMVEEKHIPFPQIYESKPMSTYGVLGIPYTILFAPNGTIIERGPLFVVEKKISAIFDESK